jgi:hypothetical protein
MQGCEFFSTRWGRALLGAILVALAPGFAAGPHRQRSRQRANFAFSGSATKESPGKAGG